MGDAFRSYHSNSGSEYEAVLRKEGERLDIGWPFPRIWLLGQLRVMYPENYPQKLLPCTGESGTAHLIFCQEGEMEEDFEGLRIGSHHNKFRNAPVETLGRCTDEQREGTFLMITGHKVGAFGFYFGTETVIVRSRI